jgi:putative ABC transport system ATP-binding protein
LGEEFAEMAERRGTRLHLGPKAPLCRTMPPSPPPLLRAERLFKAYGAQTVLDDLSLEVAAGERIALMGPSGAGKSTLLNCLGGIERADSGSVYFEGQELGRLDENGRAALRRTAIGSIFQFFHLLPTLSAAENVELPLQLLGRPARERRETVARLLDEVGVSHRAEGRPRELSGGEQQRVAIARALAANPRLLLADEPTGNLDSRAGERILDLLERLGEARKFALVMVTHQPGTTRLCHRVLHLLDGRLVDEEAVIPRP